MKVLASPFLNYSCQQFLGSRAIRTAAVSVGFSSSLGSFSIFSQSNHSLCPFLNRVQFVQYYCSNSADKKTDSGTSSTITIKNAVRKVKGMAQQTSEQKLNLIKDVDIDPQGRFKYILIKVYVDDPSNTDESRELSKFVVRGYADCAFHADIYDRLTATLARLGGLDSECVGGGRITHEKENKKLSVFGYSQGYGQADHSKAVEILKTKYADYDISWNNDGY